MDKQNSTEKPEGKLPEANVGNASNPGPDNNPFNRSDTNQLLDQKADTYIRESASIEDEPDARDQQEADDLMGGDQK